MLFPLIQKVEWTNPLRGAYQFVMIGVMGVCLYFYDGSLVNIGQNLEPVRVGAVAKSSDLDGKMAELLKTNTLSDHEDLYKIFKGISEYSKNAINIDTTLDVYKGIESVIDTYELKSKFSNIADLVDNELTPLKKPAKFGEKKKEIELLFNNLANAVKYSAEQHNWEKK